jgi:hypothetical protein
MTSGIRRGVACISNVTGVSYMAHISHVTDVAHAAIVAEMHVWQMKIARQERHQRVKHADAQTGEVDNIYSLHVTPPIPNT